MKCPYCKKENVEKGEVIRCSCCKKCFVLYRKEDIIDDYPLVSMFIIFIMVVFMVGIICCN